MPFTKTDKMICFGILISSFVLYITWKWNNIAGKYAEDKTTDKIHEQISCQSCFKIIRERSTFSDFIRRKTITKCGNYPICRACLCNHFMKLTSPGGRTGNQLFQIAALFGLSFDYGYIPIVDPSFPLLKYFDLPNVFEMKLEQSCKCAPQYPGIFYECSKSCKYDKCINMTIHGFFQSWKYFENSSDIIRNVLKIRPTYIKTARLFIEDHKKVGFKNICIHVRRTDFTTDLHQQRGFAVAPIDFIYKAINFCEFNFKKAIFFVLSDDIKWCRKYIKRDVIFSSFEETGHDLALMTLCDHVVVTSGSFGWWGAWLSNETAVYFNGYPRPGSLHDDHFSRGDYYPQNWIGL